RSAGLAGRWIHGGAAVGIAGDLVDLLERLARDGVDPSFDDLNVLQWRAGMIGGPRILQHRDEEGRGASRLRAGAQAATRRCTAAITDSHQIASVADIAGKAPAAEEAKLGSRAAGAVGLAAAQGIEQRVATVLLGPDRHQSAMAVVRLAAGRLQTRLR